MDDSIIMYARERFCPDVTRARTRLSTHALTWTEHDIESDEEAAGVVQALTGQRRVPTVVIGDTVLVEPSDAELDAALAAAGLIPEAPSEQATA